MSRGWNSWIKWSGYTKIHLRISQQWLVRLFVTCSLWNATYSMLIAATSFPSLIKFTRSWASLMINKTIDIQAFSPKGFSDFGWRRTKSHMLKSHWSRSSKSHENSCRRRRFLRGNSRKIVGHQWISCRCNWQKKSHRWKCIRLQKSIWYSCPSIWTTFISYFKYESGWISNRIYWMDKLQTQS